MTDELLVVSVRSARDEIEAYGHVARTIQRGHPEADEFYRGVQHATEHALRQLDAILDEAAT